jgi:hypothetical protein
LGAAVLFKDGIKDLFYCNRVCFKQRCKGVPKTLDSILPSNTLYHARAGNAGSQNNLGTMHGFRLKALSVRGITRVLRIATTCEYYQHTSRVETSLNGVLISNLSP